MQVLASISPNVAPEKEMCKHSLALYLSMVREEDKWAVEAFDKLRQKYELKSDAALAELLGTSRSMISVVRSGQSRPSAKMTFQLADKLGWLSTVAGVAKVAGMLAGAEVGAALEKAVLEQVTKKIQGKEEKGV